MRATWVKSPVMLWALVASIVASAVLAGCARDERFFSVEAVCSHLEEAGFAVVRTPGGRDYAQLIEAQHRPESFPFLINVYEEDPEYRSSESEDALRLPTEAQEEDGQVAERYWNVVLFAGRDTPRLRELDAALERLTKSSAGTTDSSSCNDAP